METITRSPVVIKELIAVAEDLRKGARSIKEIVVFDDEELTEEKIENKTKQTLKTLDKIAKLYELALKQAAKLADIPKAKKRPYVRAKHALARTRIEMSQVIRAIEPQDGIETMQRRRKLEDPRLLCSGPGRLCEALGITGAHDGLPLDRRPFELRFRGERYPIVAGPRIGITKAVDLPWRYGLAGSKFLSKPFRSAAADAQ